MEIRRLITNIFEENTYIIWDKNTLSAAVVDPGMNHPQEFADFDNFIRDHKLKLKVILLTHGHLDHTFGIDHVREKYGADILASHRDEEFLLHRQEQAARFRLPYKLAPVTGIKAISGGDTVCLGTQSIDVIDAPGHSQGSLVYYVKESGFVLTGDVLFRMGIGRTDLPGGSQPQLLQSIRQQLLTLPPETVVYPGHGPATTIGEEAMRF